MKLLSCLFVGMLFGLGATSTDAQAFQWAIGMGGVQADAAQALHIDPSGNVFVTGRFVGTADFDPGPGVANLTGSGIFVAKYAAAGNLVWVFQIGAGLAQYALALEADASGNILITGHFSGNVDFDPGAGSTILAASASDVFLAKYDTDGNFLWARQFGGTGIDFGYDLTTDDAGNILIAGFFQTTVDFDPGAGTANRTAVGGNDIFLAKYDANGNFLWVDAIGGSGDDSGLSLKTDAGGNAYVTGSFENSVDFDPGPGAAVRTSLGSADIFIAKYDAAGNYAWANTAGSAGFDACESIVENPAGSFIVTGYFTGVVDFDPGPATNNLTSAGSSDIFLAQFDNLGNLAWIKGMGGTNTDYGDAVTLDSCGNIYLSGYFSGTADFDPGPAVANLNAAGGRDLFFARFDALGNLDWAHAIGGTGDEFGLHVEVAADTVYLSGYFENTADFDTGPGAATLNSAGSWDAFIAKYALCVPVQQNISDTICPGNSYVFNGDTLTAPGVYTAVFKNAFCCDSIVQLSLNLSQEIHNDVAATICSGQSYYVGNSTYSTTGLFQTVLVATGGCDSIVNLDLTVLPPVQNSLTATICSGQSYYVGNFTYSTTGMFQAVLVTPEGCDSIVNLNLTVLPPLQNNLAAAICYGQSYYVGNFTYSATGMYQAVLVTPEGCDSIVQLDLTVLPHIQQALAATICSGQSFQVGDSTYTQSGVYQNILTAANGCDSIVQLDLVVEPGFVLTPHVVTPPCQGQTGSITIGINGGATPYQFAINTGPFQDQDTFSGLLPGTYTVVAQDGNGCTANATAIVEAAPVLTLDFAESEIVLNSGDSVLLQPLANFAVDSFFWRPAAGLDCTDCWQPFVHPVQSTSYQLFAYSAGGCEATANIMVKVIAVRRVFIPNIFNPDSDGLNGTFTLYGDDQVVQILRMHIYDRWGDEVFSASKLTPNELQSGWDGRYRGEMMMPGVYTYFIEVQFSDGTTTLYEGDVTLVR